MANRLELIKQLKAVGASIKLQDDVAKFLGSYDHPLYVPTVEFIVKLHQYFAEHLLNKQKLNAVAVEQGQAQGQSELPQTYDAAKFKDIDLNAAKQTVMGDNFAKELQAHALKYVETIIAEKQQQEQELSATEEQVLERDPKSRQKARKKGEKSHQKTSLLSFLNSMMQGLMQNLQMQQMADLQQQNMMQQQQPQASKQAMIQAGAQQQQAQQSGQQQAQAAQQNQQQASGKADKQSRNSKSLRSNFQRIRNNVQMKISDTIKKTQINARTNRMRQELNWTSVDHHQHDDHHKGHDEHKADGHKHEQKDSKDTKDTNEKVKASENIDKIVKQKAKKIEAPLNLDSMHAISEKPQAKTAEVKQREKETENKLRITESIKDVDAIKKAKLDNAIKALENLGVKDASHADPKAAKDALDAQKKHIDNEASKQGRH